VLEKLMIFYIIIFLYKKTLTLKKGKKQMTAMEIFNLIHFSVFTLTVGSMVWGFYKYCKNTPTGGHWE